MNIEEQGLKGILILLRRREWAGVKVWPEERELDRDLCMDCDGFKDVGHIGDCEYQQGIKWLESVIAAVGFIGNKASELRRKLEE